MKLPISLLQEDYSPVIPDERSYLTAVHSWKTMLIHPRSEPDRTCGYARRVGYTGGHAEARAIYRLRVLYRHRTVMLPGLFVFQEGFLRTMEMSRNRMKTFLRKHLHAREKRSASESVSSEHRRRAQ